MFSIGFSELILILLIAFVVVGPRDLPKVGAWLGRIIRRCSEMLRELRLEMGLDDLEREIMQTKHGLEKNLREIDDEAAYRELFEETGISNKDIELDHFMDLNYFKYENNLQVYYGILKHEVTLVEEKNKLEWVTINDELLDNSKFAGNYNIPHIIRQIKVYLKNGTGIDKY